MSPPDTLALRMIFLFYDARFWVYFSGRRLLGDAGTHTPSSLDVSFFRLILKKESSLGKLDKLMTHAEKQHEKDQQHDKKRKENRRGTCPWKF